MNGLLGEIGRRVASLTASSGSSAAAWRKRHWIGRAVAGIDGALIAVDHRGRVMFLNGIAEGMTGWAWKEAHGRSLGQVFPLIDETSGTPAEVDLPGTPGGAEGDWVRLRLLRTRDGRDFPVEYRVASIRGAGGRAEGSVLLAHDLTERRKVIEAMSRVAAIVETSDDAIIGVTLDGSIMTWNDGARRLLGYEAAEILGRPLALICPPTCPGTSRPGIEAIRRGEVIREPDALRFRRDGTPVQVSVTHSPIRVEAGRIVGFSVIARDIAERKRIEEEQRRTELLRALAEAQEGERRRIAHELHDQMEQQLAALKLGLERLGDSAGDRDRVGPLLGLVQQIGRDVHRIAVELRPATLDDLGLEAALSNCVGEWAERTGIEVDFHHDGLEDGRLSSPIETALFRVVQEALTNVLKHAEAAGVTVILECRGEHLQLIIEDDGRGFDCEAAVVRSVAERRLGLAGMKERVDAIGGTFLAESTPGRGTSLFIRIPLKSREE